MPILIKTRKAIAEALGVSPATVDYLRKVEPGFPVRRIGTGSDSEALYTTSEALREFAEGWVRGRNAQNPSQ